MGSLPQSAAFLVPKHFDYLTVETTEGSQSGCIVMPKESSVFNSTSRFAIEPDSYGLVHIRSCYNNKYLCRLSEESSLIAAAASEREETAAKWGCTLFRPERKESSLVEFYHVGTNKMVSLDWNNDLRGPLILAGPELVRICSFQIVDVAAIVRLPKRVSFKGDNGKYLCSRIQDGVPYNSFMGDDNSEEVAHYEIVETKHPEIHIKSLHTKKFLRYDNNGWIVADVASIDPYKDNPSETFKVVKVGDNVIALRNRAGEFCKRVEDENGKKNCLKACQESKVVHEGRLVVGEPVFDRRIDVQFDFKHAKIYGKEVSQTATISVVNGTDEKHELAQGFSYTKTHKATWESTNELKIGTEASITAGVPFIAKESLKLSAEYTRGCYVICYKNNFTYLLKREPGNNSRVVASH